MSLAGGGGIFVSYRREESSHLAGRLYDRLAARFGEDRVFIDVDTIEPGVDFAEEIFRAVAGCQVLLAVIGPSWLSAADAGGRRRLDDPGDIVRLEVEAALARSVRVIPILVEGAVMPTRQDLPESLAGLARRHALPVRHESFRYDAGRLVGAIERVLAASSGGAVARAPGIQPAGRAAGGVQKDSVPTRNDEESIPTPPSSRIAKPTPVNASATLIPFRPIRAVTGPTKGVLSVAFSPDSTLLATGGKDKKALLWDVATGQTIRTFPNRISYDNWVWGVAFSPDGTVLATASGDGKARLWHVATGQIIRTFANHVGMMLGVAFSPDGTLLATAGGAGNGGLWDVATGLIIYTTHALHGVAFSPDGTLLATADGNGVIRLLDVATGQAIHTFTGGTDQVLGVAFSPDGIFLATVSHANTALLWDVATGQAVRAFTGHTDNVTGVAFGPGGTFLATVSSDKTAIVWDVATGQTICKLTSHTKALFGVAFSPGGALLATASSDKKVLLWA